MKENNSNFSTISVLILILLICIFILIIFKDSIFNLILEYTGESTIQESQQTTDQTTNLLLSLEKITFDTKVLSLPYVQGLTSFPSYPVDSTTLANFGKVNPFSTIGAPTVLEQSASSTVGGIIYSGQRSLNNNNAIRATNSNN